MIYFQRHLSLKKNKKQEIERTIFLIISGYHAEIPIM